MSEISKFSGTTLWFIQIYNFVSQMDDIDMLYLLFTKLFVTTCFHNLKNMVPFDIYHIKAMLITATEPSQGSFWYLKFLYFGI